MRMADGEGGEKGGEVVVIALTFGDLVVTFGGGGLDMPWCVSGKYLFE